MTSEPLTGIGEAQAQHLHFLISSISVTSSALGNLSNAQIAGNVVKEDTVAKVSADLQAMVSKLRSVIAPE